MHKKEEQEDVEKEEEKERRRKKKEGREVGIKENEKERKRNSACIVSDMRSLNLLVNKVRTGVANSSWFTQTAPVTPMGESCILGNFLVLGN